MTTASSNIQRHIQRQDNEQRKKQNGWIKSTCAFCGVGCGIEAKPDAQGGLAIRGDQSHPANKGKLCTKGMALGDTVTHQGRLLQPQVNGQPQPWSHALDYVAQQFQQIIAQHGREAIAFYVSGQLLTEDYYVANKLMKGFIGSSHIDTNSRLCMSSSVAGHTRAFGEDVVPNCYEDIERADVVILVGSNLAWCHPVLYQRLRAAKAARQTHVIVIDPRTTATCELADQHLALHPDTDVALFNGLLAYLHQHGHTDNAYIQAHTDGFTEALAATAPYGDIAQVAAVTGLTAHDILAFYQRVANTPRTVTVYSQGVNQSTAGTDKVNSILNTHLATGRIGLPGSGPFSVTGQPNAMGGREVGGLATMLAAHMQFDNPEHCAQIREFWQTDRLATAPGLKAIDMFDAIGDGKIKAIWIMATNPAVSLPDSARMNAILAACPLVVVSDCMAETDTLRHAHVALPAQGWSEKSGTVTNSERRISRQRRLLPTPGEGKPDWWIICEVAKRMGFQHAFDYRHEADIFNEYASMTTLANSFEPHKHNERQLNLVGLTHLTSAEYHHLSPQQWPVTVRDQPTPRLFHDGHFSTPSGRARCIATPYISPTEACKGAYKKTYSDAYPLTLNTGRIRDHWHTLTRTGLSPRLSAHTTEPTLVVHPDDAKRYRLQPQHMVRITGQQGHTDARLHISTDCQPGSVFAPFHWSRSTSSFGHIDTVIVPHRDTLSGQPAFKHTPVQLLPISLCSEALLITQHPIATERWAQHGIAYWVVQVIPNGYLYRLYATEPATALAKRAQTLFTHQQNADHPQSVTAQHATTPHATSQHMTAHSGDTLRMAILNAQQVSAALVCAPQLRPFHHDTLPSLLARPLTDPAVQALFGQATSRAITSHRPQGSKLCTCHNIGRATLANTIKQHAITSLQTLHQCTPAGSGCGSCLPELQGLIDAHNHTSL